MVIGWLLFSSSPFVRLWACASFNVDKGLVGLVVLVLNIHNRNTITCS
jgi:hypothetical protein